jgi:hypothetical protein
MKFLVQKNGKQVFIDKKKYIFFILNFTKSIFETQLYYIYES